jgi:hypothetical protein
MKIKNGIVTFACAMLAGASLLQAQQEGRLNSGEDPDFRVTLARSAPAPFSAATISRDTEGASGSDQAAPQPATGQQDEWHFSVSPYLWFPGVHGTLGANDRSANFRASATDMLSHFRFGLMGTVEARKNRLVIPIDLMLIRLRADRAVPVGAFGSTSANVTGTTFIFTPKIGVTVIKAKMLEADFLAGLRYWHFGEDLNFNPSLLGLNFSKSQDWVDPLVGGRIGVPLSPKLDVTVAGDVGGWGTGSQLEYQVVGLLGYKVKPNVTLQVGYRYLDVNYEASGVHGGILDAAMSGIAFGATFHLK